MASGLKKTFSTLTAANPGRIGLSAALLVSIAGAPVALGQDAQPSTEVPEGSQVDNSAEPSGLSDFLAETGEEALGGVDLEALQAEASEAISATDEEFFVELHVNDEDLANVLQMLSIQSQRNIIASNNVSATVTANLYGVTFYEALDAILHVNGFGYLERGSFIYVYTLEELQEIRDAARQRQVEVIKLDYLTAADAAEFASPLLSADGGQIKLNGATEDFSIPDNAPVGSDTYAHDAVLVIFDYEENIDAIRELIGQIDTRPAQVLVEATILQTSVTEANAFGVDFSIIANLDFQDFIGLGGPLSTTGGLFNGSGEDGNGNTIPLNPTNEILGSGGSNVANIGGASTFQAGIIGNNAALFVRMLDEVSDTTIMSNPKVLSLNRQPARVLVGRKVGFLSTTSTETSTTQTVEFLDTGTQLYFRPFLTDAGDIRLELKPQVSEAVIREATDATGAAVTIPDEITNEITANVLVRDGQTVVLGGLFREATTLSRRQVPVLGDLPLIGGAFRGREDDVDKTEIVFMVTPSIVDDQMLDGMAAEADKYADAARAGAREGLLPFSREKQASQLLVEAQELARSGNNAKALHKLRRAKQLDPVRAGTYKMESDLGKEITDFPGGSILEGIVGNEADMMARRADDPTFYATGEEDEFSIDAVSTENAELEFDFDANEGDEFEFDGNEAGDEFDNNNVEGENLEDQSFDSTEDESGEIAVVEGDFIEPEFVEPVEDDIEGENFEGEQFASEDQAQVEAEFDGEFNNDMDESFEDEFAAELEGETVADDFADPADDFAAEPTTEMSTEDFMEPEFVTEDDIASIENTGVEGVDGEAEAEAFVMPEFDEFMFNNTVAQIATLQGAIELFQARNNEFPNFDEFGWEQLLGDNNGDGVFDEDNGEEAYLVAAPENFFNGLTEVTTGEPEAFVHGYVFNTETNQVNAVVDGGVINAQGEFFPGEGAMVDGFGDANFGEDPAFTNPENGGDFDLFEIDEQLNEGDDGFVNPEPVNGDGN